MSTGRQRRPSQLPRFAAKQNHVEELLEADLDGGGHSPQAIHLLRNVSVFDGHPFRYLHAGQAGGFLDGHTSLGPGGADTETEEAAPGLAAHFGKVVGRKGCEHLANPCAHMSIAPDEPNLSSRLTQLD